jgi:hypothetical protein
MLHQTKNAKIKRSQRVPYYSRKKSSGGKYVKREMDQTFTYSFNYIYENSQGPADGFTFTFPKMTSFVEQYIF